MVITLFLFWTVILLMFVLRRLEDRRDHLDRLLEDIQVASFEEDLRHRAAMQRRIAALEERG
jgi:hypothetical protein